MQQRSVLHPACGNRSYRCLFFRVLNKRLCQFGAVNNIGRYKSLIWVAFFYCLERFECFEEAEERNFAPHERPTQTAEKMQRLCLGEIRRGQTVLL